MKKCIYKITLIPCLFHKNRRGNWAYGRSVLSLRYEGEHERFSSSRGGVRPDESGWEVVLIF
ncbi:hypothetical protein [Draconibacterium sediminis]|uniref:hypothetical protein n=1 Tax=Draconibacterium sediminis TaxID=1544798 RepID=UPI0026EDC626|nr:hypothetical protein [Draconibacterium sediminis]